MAKAKDFLDRHRSHVPANAWWLQQWDRVLAEYDKDAPIALLVSESESACDMRSSSPFTRALAQRERTAVLETLVNLEIAAINLPDDYVYQVIEAPASGSIYPTAQYTLWA